MVELVTPLSVEPVSCPLPQGDASVPNVAEDVDAAPPAPGAISTPAAVSVVSITATPRPRKPVTLFIIPNPLFTGPDPNRVQSELPKKTLEHVPVLAH